MTVHAMVDTVPPARRRPTLQARELYRHTLVVDQTRPTTRQQRQGFNVNLRPIALRVRVAHAMPSKPFSHEARRVLVANHRHNAVALEKPANIGDHHRRRKRRPALVQTIQHKLATVLVRYADREESCPAPDAASQNAT